MIDIQAELLTDSLPIDRVGIKNLKYPIIVKDKHKGSQNTIATINMFVQLPQQYRGTHMSRFLEVINDVGLRKINRNQIKKLLLKIKKALNAQAAHIEFFFPYFINRTAPVSKADSLMEYRCGLYGSHDNKEQFHLTLEVQAIVLTLCPCSKELSPEGSAHNQRSLITLKLRSGPLIWIEDIVAIIESSASSPIYSILKRADEKYVMDYAQQNPRFVEDIVREITKKLEGEKGIHWSSVAAENYESIHNHNAYAYLERNFKEGINQ